MKRAYSTFEIKGFDDDKRVLTGIASSPTADRMGDIVEPKGAEFTLPLPLLRQHNSHEPIGHVTGVKVLDDGIEVEATLAKIDEPGTLKDRLDEAWQELKIGLVRGFSIGFQPLESAQIKDTWSYHYLKWNWLELSTVTIPANQDATIQTVKQFDEKIRSATGQRVPVVKLDQSAIRRACHKSGIVYLGD